MQAASNSIPAVRACASAWLETSTTACVQPLPAIRAIQFASTGAGGVVMPLCSTAALSLLTIVPVKPGRCPAACNTLAINQQVLVLPLVPVTPIVFICRLGLPASV